ncbi:D-alanyl-D-alanine carboxypeptidase/D-alanyl-D-alanine-endopeptidase [Acidithiobacillus sp.]|uniref:D-alanyl-D-alanine carboxypeptidase/D-alanyl-D-alanine endopeptidase n=1 Tax=Acidithiobacillus sp. TaxID=1872118 RepID=UPI002587B2D3|nr:D-alanyl-D-alanine carboxypeptidase/D-alanyl-D-alanine-endopeptidase [Acidithiobacillus sp.]MDD5375921.1 D-alanyl-D-alanine carboxypeptidase/D-alanyl-D-alanine-endopeptidase [Acidithiobacillus sp.]
MRSGGRQWKADGGRLWRRFFVGILPFFWLIPAIAATGHKDANPRFGDGQWSILIQDMQKGSPTLSVQADHGQLPASAAKLLTTAYILHELGPETRQKTRILAQTIDDGVVQGPLIFLGGGDPDLSSRRFPFVRRTVRDDPMYPMRMLAVQVWAAGVRQIPEGILADATYFPADGTLPGWTEQDQRYWYGAPIHALMFNDAMIAVQIKPGRAAGVRTNAEIVPNPGGFIRNTVITVSAKDPIRPVRLEKSGNGYLLTGAISANGGIFAAMLAQPDPAYFAAAALRQALEEKGILVGNPIQVLNNKRGAKQSGEYAHYALLAKHESPPLVEEIAVANKVSENTHVEVLLRDADIARGGDGSRASTMQGLHRWLSVNGILDAQSRLIDGCGLSREDRLSAADLVRMLLHSYQEPWGESWRDSLPVSAEDGTLRHRLGALPAGTVQAKTGTLRDALSLAGFIRDNLGHRQYAFAILVEHFRGPEERIRRRMDALVQRVALGGHTM